MSLDVVLAPVFASTAGTVADIFGVLLAVLAVLVLFRFVRPNGDSGSRSVLPVLAAVCLGVAGALLIYIPDNETSNGTDVAAPEDDGGDDADDVDADGNPVGPSIPTDDRSTTTSQPSTTAEPSTSELPSTTAEDSTTMPATTTTTTLPPTTTTSTPSTTTSMPATTTTVAPPTTVGDGESDADGDAGDDEVDDGDVDDPIELGEPVEVRSGQSFWTLAEDVAAEIYGDDASLGEVTQIWAELIDANSDRLVEAGNPDLILPGQELLVPSGLGGGGPGAVPSTT